MLFHQLIWILTGCWAATHTRFRLVRKLKAVSSDHQIGLFHQPFMSIADTGAGWTDFIESVPISQIRKTKPLVMQVPSNSFLATETSMPNHKDPKSVLALAQITQDSYFEQNDPQWIAVPGWNVTSGFGFDSGAIRGYVFENDLEDTLIIVIKGTSLATPIGSGPTAAMDKLNDNMMFSCCCAKTGWSWNKMCDCPQAGNTCSKSCLLRASNFDGSYYNLAQTIYLAVKEWFPKHTDIWMTGHSLGGALASLVALTNNLPAFAYESPGELMYAERLGLLPAGSRTDMNAFLSSLPIFHFGNTGDPIFLGQCFGPSSSCYWFSYILESHCHVGSECIYGSDTDDYGKTVFQNIFQSVRYHQISYVIDNYLKPAVTVPKCRYTADCLSTECPTWKMVD